jgi:hypothetical protein
VLLLYFERLKMKVIHTVTEVAEEGFLALLGKTVEIYCGNFIYAGVLTGVNTTCIKLTKPHIVYETGKHEASAYLRVESLCKDCQYIQIPFIESFGETKKLPV